MAESGGIRAGGAFVEFFTKDDKLKAGLDKNQKRLKDFSRESDQVGSGKFLGVALRAELIGRAFKVAAESVREVAQGTKTWSEALSDVATGLPLIGNFASGLRDVLSIVTGIGAEIEKINAEAKRGNDFASFMSKGLERSRESTKAFQQELRRLQSESRTIGLEGPELTRQQIKEKREEERIDIDERTEERIKQIKDAAAGASRGRGNEAINRKRDKDIAEAISQQIQLKDLSLANELKEIAAVVGDKAKFGTAGTFNPAAVFGLAGGGTMDRMARTLDTISENTRRTTDILERNEEP